LAAEERVLRLADIVSAHTRDVCLLASAFSQHRISNDECQQKILARCTRTCLALLAVVHEQGPP